MIMARFVMVCLVLAQILMVQAIAADHKSMGSGTNSPETEVQSLQTKVGTNGVVVAKVADPPISNPPESSDGSGEDDARVAAEAPEIMNRKIGKRHSDKSVAGGGVIIGGLVTAIFAAVFCYIRVTRRRDGDH